MEVLGEKHTIYLRHWLMRKPTGKWSEPGTMGLQKCNLHLQRGVLFKTLTICSSVPTAALVFFS